MEKVSNTSHREISFPWTTHECDNVAKSYLYPIYYLSSGRLREVKNKGNFKLLAPKVVVVAAPAGPWSDLETFSILEKGSLSTGGRNRRL